MDKRTLREFDELCLTPVRPLAPEEIRALRLREGASQAVFARSLNGPTGLVSQWERREKRPQGLRLGCFRWLRGRGWRRWRDELLIASGHQETSSEQPNRLI
jgi:putative transcriptional regulator